MVNLKNINDDDLKQIYKLLNYCKEHDSKRYELIDKYGIDTKFAYHVVRLLNQAEQILINHDLDLEQNREQLKSIRSGEWTFEDIMEYFTSKERELEKVYIESTLRHSPNETKIKNLLLYCLEEHFGNLDNAIKKDINVDSMIRELQQVINKYKT